MSSTEEVSTNEQRGLLTLDNSGLQRWVVVDEYGVLMTLAPDACPKLNFAIYLHRNPSFTYDCKPNLFRCLAA